MTDPVTFVLAVLAILATPGPTNTLLATSGASIGLKRSLPLILAEIIGYMISIHILALVIGPLLRESHALSVALRVTCAAYLFYMAWKLWRRPSDAIAADQPVRFRNVLVTTLLNPKAIIFAFVVVPHLSHGRLVQGAPYMAALAGMIVGVASLWISAGAALRASARETLSADLVRRCGAVVLSVFAAILSSSALTA
jgi:threonine/homoserine/homoserine lactone efflux protein